LKRKMTAMNANRSFILCATDFSPHAVDAATVAAKIALRRGEKLKLIHAADAPNASVRAILKSRLDHEVERLQKTGSDVESFLLNSPRPSRELVGCIRTELPSLVVVGCAVKGPIDRWALGSFSERIAESSPVPTLVVRNPAAFESWDWTKARLSILLALDFNPSSDVVLRWAKQFQLAGPCDLIACHVNWRMPTIDESTTAADMPVNPQAMQRRLERDLHKKVRDQVGDDSVEVIVRPYFGDPGPCIVEIAAERKAHIIAVGAHQRHGLPRLAQFSVSREVLHQSAINVICVPIAARFDAREAHIPNFGRVLVATDFSELGNTAIPFAYAACSIGGLVKIIHVSPSNGSTGTDGAPALTEQLRALVPNEAGARCQSPEVEVLENRDVAQTICAEAKRFGADLVCMASHGVGASRALHGSVTKGVLKRLHLPLLIIRRREE
jgi:nucleotide-binding universal stress UspA family protein